LIAVFLLVVISVVVLIHLYLWKRLVRDTLPRGRARRIAGFGVLALGLLVPATFIGSRALPHDYQPLVAWPGYIWLALMFYLLVGFLILEPVRLALIPWLRRGRQAAAVEEPSVDAEPALVGAGPPGSSGEPVGAAAVPAPPTQDARFDPSRRLLLGRTAAAVVGIGAVAITGFGVRTALGPPNMMRVPVRLPKLPSSMSGFRIAVVSDIHVGPLLGRDHTARIVRMINAAEPDMVAIVGDLVDGTVDEMGETIEPLQDLRAPSGSFFVTGNHEYFSGYEPWIDEVNSLGVRVLRNERVAVDGLDLAGVNDVNGADFGDGPDLDRALGGRDTSRPVVLLAHQPVLVHEAAKRGVDLQLSGHTHGGQIVPFNYVVRAVQPVLVGLETIDGTQVYVTRGAGFWGPPVRVGAPPDISIIELAP
jgi:uncharacterized protein